MIEDKIIPFDITKKYKKYEDLEAGDFVNFDDVSAPMFDSVYVNKYNNTVGKTKSGIEVLISKNKKEVD